MNMNLKLDFNLKTLLPLLRRLQPYIFGILLIGVFAYTALVVNRALNVGPGDAVVVPAQPAAKITFDKQTIDSVKKLDVVPGTVPTGDLGKTDPFK